jgi:hypothetical protein
VTNLLRAGPLVLLLLLLALTPGCSDDSDQPPSGDATNASAASGGTETHEADEAVEIIASAMGEHARADFRTDADARCVAQGVIDGLGVGRLEELGLDLTRRQGPELTVPPMTYGEGDLVYAAYDECLDFEARDVEAFVASGLTEPEARCAHRRYRGSPLPQRHALLQNHDQVPHPELHAQVEALWNDAQAACRGAAAG